MAERRTISLSLDIETIKYLDLLKEEYGTSTRSAAFERFVQERSVNEEKAIAKSEVRSMIMDILAEMNFESTKIIDSDNVEKSEENIQEDDIILKSMGSIFDKIPD